MKPWPRAACFAVLLALVFAQRCLSLREVRLDADAAQRVGSRWLLDDPATAYHVRRVELALANGRTPQTDAFLAHPEKSEIAWPPAYDTLLAAIADNVLVHGGGDPSLSGVDEPELEDLLAWVPPFAGLLAACALAWAVRDLVRGPRRDVAAVLALAYFAVAPVAVASTSVGHLDHGSLAAILVALQAGLTLRVLRASEPFDVVIGAMLLGLVSGLLFATASAALAFFAASWVALLAATYWGDPERQALAQRAGLLFSIVTLTVGQVTELNGPWEPVVGWTAGFDAACSELVLFASAPFLAAFLLRGRGQARRFQTMAFVFVLLMLAWYAPNFVRRVASIARGAWSGLAAVACASPRGSTLIGAIARDGAWSALASATPLALAIVPVAAVLCRAWRDPRVLFVVALSAVAVVLALLHEGALVYVALALPLAFAALADRAWDAAVARSKVAVRFGAATALLLLAAHAVAPWLASTDPAVVEERIDFVTALRWMRAGTESPGAWNSAAASADWGVLTDPSTAHLVHYHARRPTLASELGIRAAHSTDPAAEDSALDPWWRCAFESDSPARLFRELARRRGAYVVVAPRMLGRASATCGCDGTHGAPFSRTSVLSKLAMSSPDDASGPFPELSRVHASARRVTAERRAPHAGEDAGPVVSIYRVTGELDTQPRAELRAR